MENVEKERGMLLLPLKQPGCYRGYSARIRARSLARAHAHTHPPTRASARDCYCYFASLPLSLSLSLVMGVAAGAQDEAAKHTAKKPTATEILDEEKRRG